MLLCIIALLLLMAFIVLVKPVLAAEDPRGLRRGPGMARLDGQQAGRTQRRRRHRRAKIDDKAGVFDAPVASATTLAAAVAGAGLATLLRLPAAPLLGAMSAWRW